MMTEIRDMRHSAAQTLAAAFHELEDEHPDEVTLRDAWHERLANGPVTC